MLGKNAAVTLETANPYDDPLIHRLFDILRTHADQMYKESIRPLIITLESQDQLSHKLTSLKSFKEKSLRNRSIEQVEKAIPALSSLCKYIQSGINSRNMPLFYSATRAILDETIRDLESLESLEREIEQRPNPKNNFAGGVI